MANYTVIPKDLDITSLPDNKTLALDEDEKLSFSESTFSIFGELILKNLINSYENNLSDLTYDFAQADSFHIENGINDTLNTTTNLQYVDKKYSNLILSTDVVSGSSGSTNSSTTSVLYVNILDNGYFSSFRYYNASQTDITVNIRDSSNNILATKSDRENGTYDIVFSKSDYSRLLEKNETVNIEVIVDDITRQTTGSFSGNGISFTNQTYLGLGGEPHINYIIENLTNGSLNVSVSDVSDTDSVALFIDSDKPNLITPTYNTSGGELNSIDFDFSDTQPINFYGYVLYIYK